VYQSGHIILLDGPSASGKSRLKRELLQTCPHMVFCRRITTRPKRDEDSDSDYDFVSPEEFDVLERSGGLAAWRHFQFGMSYGLPRKPVEQALEQGCTVLALIDLGTVEQAKIAWPRSRAVLLYAPLEQLRQRLEARNGHSQAQIEERLNNAREVWNRRTLYDHVILNHNGKWPETLEQMVAICRQTTM
jgi:guanylate kinase